MRADEVEERCRRGLDMREEIAASPALAEAIAAIERGAFSGGDCGRFTALTDTLKFADRYMVTADFDAYRAAQAAVDRLWRAPQDWAAASMLNIARIGWFSADRTIAEYVAQVWDVKLTAG